MCRKLSKNWCCDLYSTQTLTQAYWHSHNTCRWILLGSLQECYWHTLGTWSKSRTLMELLNGNGYGNVFLIKIASLFMEILYCQFRQTVYHSLKHQHSSARDDVWTCQDRNRQEWDTGATYSISLSIHLLILQKRLHKCAVEFFFWSQVCILLQK